MTRTLSLLFKHPTEEQKHNAGYWYDRADACDEVCNYLCGLSVASWGTMNLGLSAVSVMTLYMLSSRRDKFMDNMDKSRRNAGGYVQPKQPPQKPIPRRDPQIHPLDP